MNKFKLFISILALTVMIGNLIYINLIDTQGINPLSQKLNELTFPIFMLFSFSLLFLKRRTENKDKKKMTQEDRELFKSIGKSDFDS